MKKTALFLCLLMLLGSAQAAISVRMEDTAALLSENGHEIIPADIYADIVPLGNDLFAAGDEREYILINDQGNVLNNSACSDLKNTGSLLIACRGGMYGLLDLQGREVAAFDYSRILSDGNSFWALKGDPDDAESDEVFILHADGGEHPSGLHVRSLGEAADGLASVLISENGMWGYCDESGRITVPAVFSHAGGFIAGRAAVVQNGFYGAIDISGSFVVPAEYDYLEVSPSGFILAAKNGQGVHVLNPDGSETAFYKGEELSAMLLGNGYGIISGGELRIYNAQSEAIAAVDWSASVSEGLNGQLIISDGAWGEQCVYLLGTENRYQNLYPLGMAGDEALYACMQVHAARYVSDLLDEIQYAVDMEMARYGVVNAHGEQLIPAAYESIAYLGDDRLLLYADGLWQVSDSQGEILWEYGTKQTAEPSSEEDS